MDDILITNNKLVYEKYKNRMDVSYKEDQSYIDILYTARDLVHKGYKLLTHPLSGSIKPNETPFKTIIMSKNMGLLDYGSLKIIEDSILTVEKFLSINPTPNWNKRVLDDFMVVDLSLIESIIDT